MLRQTYRGFAMVEVVMATAIVGGLAVAALSLAASSAGHKARAANQARGRVLCRSLAEEISNLPVADWSTDGIDLFIKTGGYTIDGADAKAANVVSAAGQRSLFSVIDNYHGYTESPPKDQDDNVLPGYTGWTRTVTVEVVGFSNPNAVSASEMGLRKITVEASYAGKPIASTTFLRSSEWEVVQP